jgi:hypothetical protein
MAWLVGIKLKKKNNIFLGFIDYQDGPSPSLREMGMNVDY